ncbi:asparagine synthase-related protein [Micromonospora cathayae]|uniref:Asparagine synthase-related protein n=1 Tax=Micromonospora cathayae TaxID=3028804 RepID=A0ABY7ZUC9_9ACTN|nr:asparagine synthase-related protein [Micromonospora sp. HUAS 3]WDZ86612.1 asparagine synthase-related protein [Micromonospora sp. HUAS 3]
MPVLVLPDVPLPAPLRHKVAAAGPVLFHHPSGNPWIVGSAAGRTMLHARTRDIDVVLLGTTTDLGNDDLARLLAPTTTVTGLDVLAARATEGDVLLFARERGRLRCQGPLLLTRSLCWTTIDGVPVLSDEQFALKELAVLRPDPAVLASRLTDAELSHPFALHSIWQGLHCAGPGQWIDFRGARPPVPVTWWRPPAADESVGALAGRLRTDLADALRVRTAPHRTISADLSGGLDSTTLVFALADLGRKPRTLFLASDNVANVDHVWAGRAAAELGTDHLVAPYSALFPYLLDPLTSTVITNPEGPGVADTSLASTPMTEGLLRATGTTLHLNGHGGDALFGPVSSMLWSLFRSRDRGRLRRIWQYRSLNRYPLRSTVRMLAHRGTYRQDLERIADHDFASRDDNVAGYSRWVPLPKVHPALTDIAHGHLRALAAAAVTADTAPLSPDRTTHQILQYLTFHGTAVRRMNQAARTGLCFDSPYLDRRVVETSLALGVGDRTRQYPAKPLLAAARPAAMVLDYFTRADKGDYTAEVFAQHQAMKPMVRELFADGSALADLGLVDPAVVLRHLDAYSSTGDTYTDLANIALAERWLRSAG